MTDAELVNAVNADTKVQVGTRSGRTIQSVDRALDILEVLSSAGGECLLNEIASAVKLNVSTCHHLLNTLVARGYVGKNTSNRAYFLGHKIMELSSSRVRQFNLLEEAMLELRRLNDETGETVHLAVMQGTELVTLGKIDSKHAVRVGTDLIGKSDAAHATATGKAILAWLPEPEIARVIADKGLSKFTGNTLISIADLMENLRHVRRNGYSVDDEEFQPGVICFGSAVRDHSGAVIASISCSMPTMRSNRESKSRIRNAVCQCASRLSEQLGSPA